MNGRRITNEMISCMAKQSLKSSHMRNIFVTITIVFASALLTTVLMFAAGQKQHEKNQLSHRQQVVYYNLTAEQVEKLKKDERIVFQIQVKTGVLSEMNGFDVKPFYVSELSDKIQIGELECGELPKLENEIAVYAAMLEKMNVEPDVGSRVTFHFYDGSTETFIVSGILKGGETAKQFSVFFSAQYAENGNQLKERPYEVYAKLYGATKMHPEDCKEEMYWIGSDAGIEREYINPSKAFLDSLSLDAQSILLYGLIGVVILLACVLVIYGVFYLSVVGRIHQFGQLRTIGMTKKQIKKLVSREGGVLFLRSAPIGIIIGVMAGYCLIPDGFFLWNLLLIITLVFGVVFAVTMISVHKPAKLAAAVSPMEALRYVPEDGMKKAKNKKICRKLTPLGLGMMNFSKNKKKAVITMLSLALGGILFMTAATYMSSFDRANYARQGFFKDAEFTIQYSAAAIALNENGMSGIQATTPLGDEMVQRIAVLEGVHKVKEIKGLGINFDYPKHEEYGKNDMVYPLTEEEFNAIHPYLSEGSADYEKLMSGDYILVAGNDTAEEIYGWKFMVGDVITFHYFDGDNMSERDVTVLGILNNQFVFDHNGLEGWSIMPEQAILNMVSYDSLNVCLVVSTRADKEAEIGEALIKMVENETALSIETLAERRISYEQSVNRIFGAISGLSIFIMMFSILSMMNTLITNIVTRKQELAVLESIGMSKEQIRTMLFGESLCLIFATVGVTITIGTMCGYILSSILYHRGAYYMTFRFPMVLAFAYVVALTTVPLGIIFVSMHSFSKEALVERLRGIEN